MQIIFNSIICIKIIVSFRYEGFIYIRFCIVTYLTMNMIDTILFLFIHKVGTIFFQFSVRSNKYFTQQFKLITNALIHFYKIFHLTIPVCHT